MFSNSISNNDPIGIFDSGIGGLTILKEIVQLLPHENIIYMSDDKNCPYGAKTSSQIVTLSIENTKWLLEQGAKIVVIACNTATMASVATLRQSFNVNFVAIEPAIKPASTATKSGIVGIIATKSSIESEQLKKLCNLYASDKIVITKAGIGLAALVENNKHDSEEAYDLLKTYLDPMLERGIDHLVLGCTHYPFFKKNIKKIIADRDVTVINPAKSIAKQLKKVMKKNSLLNSESSEGIISFHSTDPEKENNELRERYIQYLKI